MPSQQPEPLTVVITINTASVGRNAHAEVTCPACGRHLMVLVEGSKRNRKVNERICQESDGGCGSNLIIIDEDGNELNEPWATLESNLSRAIGEMFHADAFPDRVTAQKWNALERSVRARCPVQDCAGAKGTLRGPGPQHLGAVDRVRRQGR